MLIPIILIIVCNCFIIYKSIKNDYKRKKLKSGRVKLIQSNENIFDLISPPVLEETKSFRMTDMANSPKVDGLEQSANGKTNAIDFYKDNKDVVAVKINGELKDSATAVKAG